ncbi:MAG: bifunctional adenosylcobinamide kinase/adenosylcobinamide-phosphate guanylyltransferase [Deltaproteobacteria bacterium]|nr:bifunctional adenosylcobinamide kinase/adenosylcobinamide-phosphate guanylyltransferase [Deltaproteobacteria bacterium]
MGKVTLITGGARSGKSRFGLTLGQEYSRPVFLATAEVTDAEMALRIDKHRHERGDLYTTVEEPLDPARILELSDSQVDFVLIDCLTVWLGNLMHHLGQGAWPYREMQRLLKILEHPPCDVALVSNELGMGLVPENEMGRWFRDVAGRLNQDVAIRATEVVFMVSGCPVWVKKPVERTTKD